MSANKKRWMSGDRPDNVVAKFEFPDGSQILLLSGHDEVHQFRCAVDGVITPCMEMPAAQAWYDNHRIELHQFARHMDELTGN